MGMQEAPVEMRRGRASFNGHYAAVSTSDHYDTYEFRMFAGVTREVTAKRFVETLDAIAYTIAADTQHGLQKC